MPKVLARLRPSTDRSGASKIFKVGEDQISVQEDDSHPPRQIKFHHVFDASATNEEVFAYVKGVLLGSLLKSKHDCTVFSYGETGSGKTYTMYHVIKAFVGELLRVNSAPKEEGYEELLSVAVEVSCVEINMAAANRESILDLLNKKKELRLQFSHVEGATAVKITSAAELEKNQEMVRKLRTTKATAANSASSRSHCIYIARLNVDQAGCSFTTTCHFVDLAGSERMAQSRRLSTRGQNAASAINPSLSNFSNIVRMIAVDKMKEGIPFRNSYLTRILQPCFKGEGELMALFCLNPANPKESHSTLVFAQNMLELPEQRVKGKKVIVTQDQVEKANKALLQEISELRRELGEVSKTKGVLEEENLKLKSALEAHVKQNAENLETANEMVADIKNENKKNAEGMQATKQEIAKAVKNIKKEFGVGGMRASSESFNPSDGFGVFLDEQAEEELGQEGLQVVESAADIFADLKAVYKTLDKFDEKAGAKLDLPPEMEGLNFKLNSLVEMVQGMQASNAGFKDMSQEQYGQILEHLALLEKGTSGLQQQGILYNDNEEKAAGLKQNAANYVKEIQEGLGKIRALQAEAPQKVLKKVRRESVLARRKLANDADDSRSQHVQARPEAKPRYFKEDSDGELDIPSCNVPSSKYGTRAGFRDTGGETLGAAESGEAPIETDASRSRRGRAWEEPEEDESEYYETEYYDSEEEAELERQTRLEQEIIEKVERQLKNSDLFSQTDMDEFQREFRPENVAEQQAKRLQKHQGELDELLKLLPGSRDRLITLVQQSSEIPPLFVQIGGMERVFEFFQQDTYMANMAVLLRHVCVSKEGTERFALLGGQHYISKLLQVKGSREKDFDRISGLQLMAQVVQRNTTLKDYFLGEGEDMAKLMSFLDDKNQGILEAAANAVSEVAEDYANGKDQFLQLGLLTKLGYKIILNENNEVTIAMLAALGRMVHKHAASQETCRQKIIQVRYEGGDELLSCLDGIVQGMNDDDDQVKEVAQQAFLNLILDNEQNVQEILGLNANSLDLESIKQSSFEALAKVFCNTFAGAARCEKRGSLGEQISYFAVGLKDAWTRESAGGSNKEVFTYIKNPQYQMYIPEDGASVSIYLQGTSNVKYAQHTFFHVTVFKVEIDQKFDVDLSEFIGRNRRGREEGAIVSFKAPKAGYYSCVVSHTVVGRPLDYQVAFVADCDIKVQKQELQEDWAFAKSFYSVWEEPPLLPRGSRTQFDADYSQTFWNNPQFLVRRVAEIEDAASDQMQDLVEEESYLIVRAEHFDAQATRDINGRIKNEDEIHLNPTPYADSYWNKRCVGEAQNGPKMDQPVYNVFGDQAQMKINLGDVSELAVNLFRGANKFERIVTSFFSNVPLEVVQVGKEQEWDFTYSTGCQQLLNDSAELEFRVSAKKASTIAIGFKLLDTAQIEDLSPYKFTVQIQYPDKTVETSKHNAHGFFSKAWLIKVKPEYAGKDISVICKPRDERAQLDFSQVVLNVASEGEVAIVGQTELSLNTNILAKKSMALSYTFEPVEERARDELLENQDMTAKRLEFKAIENENLKQCVEALQQANEMYKNKLKKWQGNDEYEYVPDVGAQIEQKNKEIYELQKINLTNQQKIHELSENLHRSTDKSALSMMKSSADDMFAPANMMDALPKASTKGDNEKDKMISELQAELQRCRSEVESLRPLESFFVQMNQTYMERYSNRGSSVRPSYPSVSRDSERPSDAATASQMAHTFHGKASGSTEVTKRVLKVQPGLRARQLSASRQGEGDGSDAATRFEAQLSSFYGGHGVGGLAQSSENPFSQLDAASSQQQTRPVAGQGQHNIRAEAATANQALTHGEAPSIDFSINSELKTTFNDSGMRLGVPGGTISAALTSQGRAPHMGGLMPPKSPMPPRTGPGGPRSNSKTNTQYSLPQDPSSFGDTSLQYSDSKLTGQRASSRNYRQAQTQDSASLRPATQQQPSLLFSGSRSNQGSASALPDIHTPNAKQPKLRIVRGASPQNRVRLNSKEMSRTQQNFSNQQ